MRRACSAFAAFLGRSRGCYCPYRADDVSHVIPPVPAWYCLFLHCLDLVFPVACRCDKKATVWSQQTTPYSAEQKIYGLRRKQTNNKQLEKEETHSRRASAGLPITEQAISWELRSCTTVEHWNCSFHKGRRARKIRAAATRKQGTPGNHRMGGRERVAVTVALPARLQRDRYTETEAGDDLYLHLHSYMTDHNWVSNLK